MALDPVVMQAVEKLGYRVTVGDVASQAGLNIQIAERELLALASEASGHMQVSEAGEIAYLFPKNFRSVLQNKYLRLRLQKWWSRIWRVLFYIIRISFGILLIASIVLITLAIIAIMVASSSSRDSDNRGGSSHGGGYMPTFWISPDWFWVFTPDYYDRRPDRQRKRLRDGSEPSMNFLEAVFSFLFGDGNPNADLEERRWQTIATVIRNNGGAVAAEQIAPYLDQLGSGYSQEFEDYMLPVLTRFNGRPEVSPEGQIVYHFPELQVTATQRQPQPVSAYLRESLWRFSQAGSGQITLAAGLGVANLAGAVVLGNLLRDGTIAAQLGGLVAFASSIYWLLLGYGIGFLAIPLIRYFWVRGRNRKVNARNEQRQQRAVALNEAGPEIQQKIAFAHQFAATHVVSEADLVYTTEEELTSQELQRADQIDEEWRKRLEQSEF